MPEGTIFKCSIHDYGTSDSTEWRDHKAEFKHNISGNAKCNQCGIKTHLSVVSKRGKRAPALCNDCADTLLADREEKHAKEKDLDLRKGKERK